MTNISNVEPFVKVTVCRLQFNFQGCEWRILKDCLHVKCGGKNLICTASTKSDNINIFRILTQKRENVSKNRFKIHSAEVWAYVSSDLADYKSVSIECNPRVLYSTCRHRNIFENRFYRNVSIKVFSSILQYTFCEQRR